MKSREQMEVNINKSIQFLLVIGKHEKQGEKGGISEYPILRIIRQHGVKPKDSCLSVKELIHTGHSARTILHGNKK